MDDQSYDVVIVGSGFGGSVAALRLTEKGYRVAVLEAGNRVRSSDFPRSNWDVRRALWYPRVGLRGALRLTLLRHALVFHGAGVGGGSLVFGGVLQVPPPAVWEEGSWAGVADWEKEMPAFFDAARQMLGATTPEGRTAADDVLARVADRLGAGDTYRRTEVGIHFGRGMTSDVDPRLLALERHACTQCGGCLTGCREGAKNSLDFNYLWLAEQLGAKVYPLCQVFDVARHREAGYTVRARDPRSRRGRVHEFRARHVVLAAGVLGTTRLLLALKKTGAFPRLSPHVGGAVRTNGETIVTATAMRRDRDYSTGHAITSAFHPDEHTQVQAMRFPAGSNALAALSTILLDGDDSKPPSLRFLNAVLRRPVMFLRSLSNWHWSERSILFLVMRRTPESFRLQLRRRGVKSESESSAVPSYVPVASDVARSAAEVMGGYPSNLLNDALLGRPSTGHILGGATIAPDRDTGVIDGFHRVHGYPDIHVMDASAIAANLGTNPALTIAALAERAANYWPRKGETDTRPPQPRTVGLSSSSTHNISRNRQPHDAF